MTRKEAERLNEQEYALLSLGFTTAEAEQLRRISMTLHRWSELECNGDIERDGENGDGLPFRSFAANGGKHHAYRVPDRERGALKRLKAIINARNARKPEIQEMRDGEIRAYVQGDPRGAALYILRPGDVPEGQSDNGYYNRGICVY